MGYDSDGRETSSSEGEDEVTGELRREFEAYALDHVMDSRGNYGARGNYGQRRGSFGNQRGAKPFGKKRQQDYSAAQNIRDTQEIEEEPDYNQEAYDDEEEYEITPPTWNEQLKAIGYDKNRIECPNAAVQTILCCIKNMKVHELILEKEAIRKKEQISAVTHLGFSEWLMLLPLINKLSDKEGEVYPFIAELYDNLPHKVYNWTKIEDECSRDFIIGVTALEDANDIKNTHAKEEEQIRIQNAEIAASESTVTDDIFGYDLLTEEDKAMLKPKEGQGSLDSQVEFKFNLRNCLKFPIIPDRLVENHGLLCNQAIWRTKNFGALAPISEDAWLILGDISKEMACEAKAEVIKMNRIKKTRVKLPVGTRFFDKKCTESEQMMLAQKGHMAYTNITRDDFYLKRIWRTMCPYFKCICEDKSKMKQNMQHKSNVCDESMIWFDQAVWYMLNNLNALYPNMSYAGQMVAFRNCLKGTLKNGVLAFIGYLEVRKMLMGMTMEQANNPQADFKINYPKGIMTDICEKTIKPADFLKGAFGASSISSNKMSKYSGSAKSSNSSFKINDPPRITSLPCTPGDSVKSDAANVVDLDTPGNMAHSYTKSNNARGVGDMGNTAQMLAYDK